MIRRRLRFAALIVVCALALAVGLPLIGLLFGAGVGLFVAGMYGFILGGFALIYMQSIETSDPGAGADEETAEALCGRLWESLIESMPIHSCTLRPGHAGAHRCNCGSEFM